MSELDRAAEKSVRGRLYLFMGNFLAEIINAVGVVLVARLLTPEEYGVYNVRARPSAHFSPGSLASRVSWWGSWSRRCWGTLTIYP